MKSIWLSSAPWDRHSCPVCEPGTYSHPDNPFDSDTSETDLKMAAFTPK